VDWLDLLIIVYVFLSNNALKPLSKKLANTKKVVSESINIPNIIDSDRGVTNDSCPNNLSLLVSSKSDNTSFFHDWIFEHLSFSYHVSIAVIVQLP